MVLLVDRALMRVLPPMAPTTRSAHLSLDNIKPTKALNAKNFQEASSLKVYKAKAGKNLKKEKKVAPEDGENPKEVKKKEVAPEEETFPDMEDFGESARFSETEAMEIRTGLLSWYDRNHRVLPWRINPFSCLEDAPGEDSKEDLTDMEGERAYAVWVSEMMLQQTRVATVITYYERWMSTWPTVHALAQASQEEVNTVWAGLGYYRRARFLLEGAKKVVHDLGGRFPRTVEELQQVPGIGSYTAGAIASIAFKQAVPVVDGNVIRVLCRLRAISLNPKASATVKLFWALASQLVGPQRAGDFNQALMELGATTCTPTSPSCTTCPIASQCTAVKLVDKKTVSSVTSFPMKVVKAAPREEYVAVCIVERETSEGASSKLLLVQRPLKGLLAGLWEFPCAPLDSPESSEEGRGRAIDEYLEGVLGVEVLGGKRQEVGSYVHVFSHIRLHMYVEWLLLRGEEVEEKSASKMVTKWVDLQDMSSLGLTSGVKKVYKMFSGLREKQLAASKATKRKRSS